MNKKHLDQLIKTIQQYDEDAEEAKKHLEIKGKTLRVANQENPSWLMYYDQQRIAAYKLMKVLSTEIAKTRGRLYKQYTENYSVDLGDRGKEQYINTEPEYLEVQELFLECQELHDKFSSIVEAFRARGFALNNITKAVVAEVQDYILE